MRKCLQHLLLCLNEHLSTSCFGSCQKYQGGFDPQPYIKKSVNMSIYLDKLQYFAIYTLGPPRCKLRINYHPIELVKKSVA
jgi:hypothetical protein